MNFFFVNGVVAEESVAAERRPLDLVRLFDAAIDVENLFKLIDFSINMILYLL